MRSFANLFRNSINQSISAGRTLGTTLREYALTRRKSLSRPVARKRFGAILLERLEPRHLMAAVPV
ncbi:MAG: hypothetical protein SFV81_16605, partial [Pirellulaceae bacterium]|nr:hypothetical protein [Pirellulaceae bacterium]